MAPSRIAVIGAGIIGLAVARALTRRFPDASLTVFEATERIAGQQSGATSGIVDPGLDETPGSLNARLAEQGAEQLAAFCRAHDVPFEERGRLIVAHTTSDVDALEALFARAHEAGIPVRMRDRAEMAEVEPHVRGVLGLHSPTTSITDFGRVADALGEEVRAAGGEIRFTSRVGSVSPAGREVRLRTSLVGVEVTEDAGAYDLVIACAGLESDRLAEAAGLDPEPRIVPFRGDYYALDRMQTGLVGGVISPVRSSGGVQILRTVSGSVLLGPNVYPALGRGEGFDLADLGSTLGHRGFWNLARRGARDAVGQARTVVSRTAFVEQAKAVVPEILAEGVRPGPKGTRAQALSPEGEAVDDLVLTSSGRVTMVRALPRAAATACLPIAELIVDEAHRSI